MRLLCFCLTLLCAFPVYAQNIFPDTLPAKGLDPLLESQNRQTQSLNQIANGYYKRCMTDKDNTLSNQSHNELCACLSANIPQVMTREEYEALSENTDEGHFQRSRFLTVIYTSCYKYPVREVFFNSCLKNTVKKRTKNSMPLCECVADNISRVAGRSTSAKLVKTLNDNENNNITVQQTLDALQDHKGFQQKIKYYNVKCVQKHKLGWQPAIDALDTQANER